MSKEQEVADNSTTVEEEELDLDLVKQAEPRPIIYEDVIETMGNIGRFQFVQMTLCLVAFIPSAVMLLGFVFIGFTPPHVCNAVNETEVLSRYGLLNDSTATVSYGSCKVTVSTNQSGAPRDIHTFSCPNGRNFTGGKHLTLVSEWDLVCESTGMAEVGQTLLIAGQVVGGFFVAPVADRFGRKWVMISNIVICSVIELSSAFSPNIYTVWALLLLQGIFFIGFDSTLFVLGLEHLAPKHRVNFGVAAVIVWAITILNLDVLGYLFRDIGWRYFQAAGAVSGAIVFVWYPCFLCESPRWLASKNRPEDALAVLKKACQQNRIDFTPVKNKFQEYVQVLHPQSQSLLGHHGSNGENEKGIQDGQKVNYNLISLLRDKHTLLMLCMCWCIWITQNITYYGIFMTSSSLSGNRFINFCILTLVELPSNLTIWYMMKRANRLFVLRVFILMTAISLLASSLVPQFFGDSPIVSIISTALFIFGKFAVTASFNVVYIYTPEVFPTVVRSSAFGACKGAGRVGSLLAPYFRPLYDMLQWAPGVVFSVICVISLCATSFLPETKGKMLPTNMEEMKQQMQVRKKRAGDTDNK